MQQLSTAGTSALDRLHADALLLIRATGHRIGELHDLELDCVHEIDGHGAWLKVPLGKLATERMIPLDEEPSPSSIGSTRGEPLAAPRSIRSPFGQLAGILGRRLGWW